MRVTEYQGRLLSRFTRLRAALWAVSTPIASTFARNAKRGWDDQSFGGMAAACHALQGDLALADLPGSYSVLAEARALAVAFAAVPA